MRKRGPWEGMMAIVRFNWPLYAVALLVLVAGIAGLFVDGIFRLVSGLVALGCCWFLVGSLGVSHWVYDRSELYRWPWLSRVFQKNSPEKMLLCHSGFDEASERLKPLFPAAQWTVLDHFDPATMTEASIRRARKLFPPTPGTIAAKYDHWPLAGGTQNVVFGLLAIHELRTVAERAAWFREAGRCLASDGSVVLVEHVRDLANFAAFGPGFLHFHSVASWRNSWEAAGFIQRDHFRITPFVRVFVLTPK
jgi:hypothetical protein